ncbi:hypothetical protein [Paraurantiacibacter namhicola]|uniref:5-bromo-4-chloroindolyl phosphate hydrolysis protein n=1 Tax=Paraurantiacibacter namhicola TaxID=645517 RepID=A0A1C7D6M3_9SPHN|nr:hypothetical protein [Paraurantiacibacter namhicola]ANU07105.1 hypothetical protein A6F65_00786 [Paraurantiacibacter namhicola]
MSDSTSQSREIMASAKRSLADQRAGGRRLEVVGKPIGRGSARIRSKHFTKKLVQLAIGIVAIAVGVGIAGAVLDGIGFWGIMVTILVAILLFSGVLSQKMKVPGRVDLTRTQDAKKLVARTELWLEAQRPALPPPAVQLVDDIGVQLDQLGAQLAHVDPAHPAAAETRKLVGELLPETVDSYRKIPGNLRGEKRAGATPDEQLTGSLRKISKEIDHVTRQLAEGSLDDLAVRTRYLDYKYGDPDSPVADTEKT